MSSRFTDNAYGGEAVETFGTVTEVENTADGQRVSCEVGLTADARSFRYQWHCHCVYSKTLKIVSGEIIMPSVTRFHMFVW